MTSNRTDAVHALCSRLASEALAAGQKSWRPSVSLMKANGIKGSQTDLQNDIHDWVQASFQARLDMEAGVAPGVPQEYVSAFLGFVDVARGIARQELENERQALTLEVEAARNEARIANGLRDEALSLKDATASKLETAEAICDELRQQVADQKAQLIARDGQIAGLNDAMANLRADHASRIAEFEAATNLAHERYEAMERKLLLEIDGVRIREHALQDQIKDFKGALENARATEKAMERRAANAENALAEARGKLEAIAERISDAESARDAMRADLGATTRRLDELILACRQSEEERDSALALLSQMRKECGR